MGTIATRSSNTVEETDIGTNHAYKYPPKSGNYFGTHFIMGGERFDTPQPESYLFGENADLNFLGCRPTAFPYPPPQTNEPTKTLKSLINIRKESVRFVKTNNDASKLKDMVGKDDTTNVATSTTAKGNSFNIEFIFDSDAKCAITIYYFCTEEITSSGLSFVPRDSSLTSETYHYKRGVNQLFSQPTHQINPNMFSDDDLSYNPERDIFPVAIHCVVEEGIEESITKQSHTTVCVIDHHAADGAYVLRALKQKIFVDGLCYLLQEIYGIENKNINKISMDEETDDNGSECVICMCDTRDTLILPCRHLCLCNSCADSLRYQASNCPICRAPFRALLQIRSVQKSLTAGTTPTATATTTTTGGTTTTTLTPTGAVAAAAVPATTILPTQNVMISQTQNNSQDNNDNLPPGYISVPLIEALNGPPQIILRNQHSIDTIDINEIDAVQAADQLNRNLDKQSSPKHIMDNKHSKDKINPPEQIRMSVLIPKDDGLTHTKHGNSMMENNSNGSTNHNNNRHEKSPRPKIIRSLQLQQEQYGTAAAAAAVVSPSSVISHRDNVKIINEKNLQYNLHSSPMTQTTPTSMTSSSSKPSSMMDVDDDSDAEKLSPLLDQPLKKLSIKERKNHQQQQQQLQLQHQHQPLTNLIINNSALHMDGVDESIDDTDTDMDEQECDKNMRSDMSNIDGGGGVGNIDTIGGGSGIDASLTGDIMLAGAEDSDYYTPEDPHTTILSPLCSDKKSTNDLTKSKDNLTINHPSPLSNIKQAKTNSLPDSPISGNSTSTRSSGDSYSSSSSTRQLLSASIPSQDIIKLSDDKQHQQGQQQQHSSIDKIVAV